MDVQTTLYPLLSTLVSVAVTTALGFLAAYIRSHFSAKQVETAQSIATMSVSFAQQVASALNLDSEGKYNAALGKAKEFAAKYGLKLTDSQWQGLIEAAVKDAKDFWSEVAKPDEPNASVTPDVPTAEQKADSVQSPQETVVSILNSVGQNAANVAINSFVQQSQEFAAKMTVPQTATPAQ